MTKTVDLADGITITVRRRTVRDSIYETAIRERLGTDESQTLNAYAGFYALCASQTVDAQGIDWQPPGMYASVDEVRQSFDQWLDGLPSLDAVLTWIDAVAEVNAPAVDDELTPGFEPDEDDEGAEKK